MNDNLPELRDIHLPLDANFFWPIAYGWWVLLSALLLTVCLVYLFVFLKRKSKKHYALKLLSKLDLSTPKSAVKMSEILRRICVYKYPKAAVLINDDWVQFLNAHTTQKLNEKTKQLLLNAPYMKPQSLSQNADSMKELQDFCLEWIGENL